MHLDVHTTHCSVGTASAQAPRPGHMPDGRFEYRTAASSNTLIVSDCQTAPQGEVAGQAVHATLLKSCRVRMLSRADGGGGAVSAVQDLRTVLAWTDGLDSRSGQFAQQRIAFLPSVVQPS